VFGASLNGVEKRPTYVLKFEKKDLDDILPYLEGHTQEKTLAQVQAAWDKKQEERKAGPSAGLQQPRSSMDGLG
jgi:hypothetical protein